MFRRLLHSKYVRWVLARLLASYLSVVYRTSRWDVYDRDVYDAVRATGTPIVLCFWHGRLALTASCFHPLSDVHVLSSLHRDGRFIAQAINYLGLKTIDGSSSRRAAAALRDMARVMRAGEMVAITPDGPRGPYMHAAAGAIVVARLVGATVVPVSASVQRGVDAGSWDHLIIPLPFNRGSYRFGEPLAVPQGAEADVIETLRQELERRLIAVTGATDRDVGWPAPPPAHPASAV